MVSRCMQAGIEDVDARGFIIFPLAVHTMDLVVSAVGIMSVGDKPGAKQPGQALEDPYEVLKVGSCCLSLYTTPGEKGGEGIRREPCTGWHATYVLSSVGLVG